MPDDLNRDELIERCKEILKRHVGKENAINAEQLLTEATGELIIPRRSLNQTRIIRSVVEQMESEGEKICHVTGANGGYFIAASQEDIDNKIAWFMKRIKTGFKRIMNLNKMTFEDVVKQIELEFEEEEDGKQKNN